MTQDFTGPFAPPTDPPQNDPSQVGTTDAAATAPEPATPGPGDPTAFDWPAFIEKQAALAQELGGAVWSSAEHRPLVNAAIANARALSERLEAIPGLLADELRRL